MRFGLCFLLTLALCAGSAATVATASPPPPTLEQLDAELGPVFGITIISTVPGSQAETLGIGVGDVIAAINGDAVFNTKQFSALLGTDGGRTVTLVSNDGRRRTVDLAPGRIGIGYVSSPQRLTLSVSRNMARGPAWNRHVIAAAWALEAQDYENAERLLSAAREAGYPDDAVMPGLTFRLHMGLGRYAAADELLNTMPARTDGRDELYLPGAAERGHLLLATGRCDAWVDLVESEPAELGHVQNTPNWPRDKKLFRGVVGGNAPHAGVEDRAVQAVNPTLSAASRWVWGKEHNDYYNRRVIASKPVNIRSASGSPAQTFLSRFEDFGDFDLHARFKVALTGPVHPHWGASLCINVSDLQAPAPNPVDYFAGETSVLGARFSASHTSDSARQLLSGWAISQPIHEGFFDGTTERELHFSRRDGWGTITLDGVTVLSRPVDPKSKRLVFHIHVVGVKAEFSRFDITEPRAKP